MDLNTSRNKYEGDKKLLPPKITAGVLKGFVKVDKASDYKPKDKFSARLEESLNPGMSAKELIKRIVFSALDAEFGPNFTHTSGFDKMVNTIADSIVASPDLRRQSLAIASEHMGKKVKVMVEKKPENQQEKG